MGTFFAQFCALCRKNWIILWRHRWVNLLRCLLLPIAYAAFFAQAQQFFTTHAQLGDGYIAPIQSIPTDYGGLKFVWAYPGAATATPANIGFVRDLVGQITAGRAGTVIETADVASLERECPQNYNWLSECYAGLVIAGVDPATSQINYTIRGDLGLAQVDVDNHASDDVQTRFLPLQWAVESNFIQLTTGTLPPEPLNWEYTNETQEERDENNRLSYLRGIRSIIVLAHFLVFLGVVYQLPGSMTSERASSLTAHLDAMGCRKSARVISWHLSISSAYFIAWVVVAVIFQQFIYERTNAGLMIVLYVVTGLSLASWTHMVAVPFASSPTLAAITSTFFAIILAIVGLLAPSNSGTQILLTLIFPPTFYTFISKALSAWENVPSSPNILKRSPRGDAPILALLIVAIIDIFLFPLLATWMEQKLYGVRPPGTVGWFRRSILRKGTADNKQMPDHIAVQLEHCRKEYSTKRFGVFGRGKPVVAIEELSFDIPKGEIFCLLGRNGAAKSTTLSAIARLLSMTSGQIRYAPDLHVGIATQKDVLWDELTCKQHVELWRAIKNTPDHLQTEPDLDLLARCDLAPKTAFLSKNLSGGQKRKLQLACALAGGSNLLLLDEISSGLDPLSRRAIWKLITANRGRTTIVLTTHFLDEADYLGDQVAILKAPGKLLALQSPVSMKHDLGRGFTIAIEGKSHARRRAAKTIQEEVTGLIVTESERKTYIGMGPGINDIGKLQGLVDRLQHQIRLQNEDADIMFQINSSTLEDVFLDLNTDTPSSQSTPTQTVIEPQPETKTDDMTSASQRTVAAVPISYNEKDAEASSALSETFVLHAGRKPSPFLAIPVDAFTIFRKRLIVLRRSWLLPLISILVAICATCIPLFFLAGRNQTCDLITRQRTVQPLTYARSPFPYIDSPVVLAPEALFTAFQFPDNIATFTANNQTFVDTISQQLRNLSYGGISLSSSPSTTPSLFAWEGSALRNRGLSALNLLNNMILDTINPPLQLADAFRINLEYEWLPTPSFLSTAIAMKWIAFFGLGVAVWPAFAVVYPTLERASNVRSNQYSNGAAPVSLWFGHLMFEMPQILFVSTIITIIFFVVADQFNAPGYLFICFFLYGIASTLYAFLAALFLNSSLAAWALVAGTNVILFLLYLASYLLILTYDRSANAQDHMTIAHFTISLINPVPNIVRAGLVSVNLFGLLCDGLGNRSPNPYNHITQFGGPILYLVLQALFAYGVLIYVDSGSPVPPILRSRRKVKDAHSTDEGGVDVAEERERVARGTGQELEVRDLSKRYNGAKSFAVNGASFAVGSGTTFALIGPNGAGKTTTLACIRGVEVPSGGDVNVSGHSIVKARNAARSNLGVCPQVNAIDANLTVRQHLWLYGRLKGVPAKPLKEDIHTLLSHAGLLPKADQLATSLSGGNQRKLSLAIALIGDRPVVLIDEFSSGVDPFSKREAWTTLAALTKDRAVVMTTHSMEEVDALATRVGIIASRMLAVGTPQSLKSRFATYEIHLSASAVTQLLPYLQANGFHGAHRSYDTVTRISVPGVKEAEISDLLRAVAQAQRDLDLGELTIHEASTETAFLEIVRQHNIREEEGRAGQAQRGGFTRWFRRS